MVNCGSAPVIPFYRDATPINVGDGAAIRETVIPAKAVADFEKSGLFAGHFNRPPTPFAASRQCFITIAIPSAPAGGFFMGNTKMLTASTLRKLLSYSKSTGLFRWRVRTSNRIRVGSMAGTVDANDYTVIKIAGKRYYAARLATLAMTGERPANNVTYRNGQRSDNQWINIRA
jgi:hypothetical protein